MARSCSVVSPIPSLSGTAWNEHVSTPSHDPQPQARRRYAGRDRSLGFQVAEAGLREAEASLDPSPTNFPGAGCNAQGLCARPLPTAVDRWLDPAFTAWRTASVSDPNTDAPRYIVEEMGEGPNWRDCDRLSPIHPLCLTPRYRVTVRSQQDGRASVLLQTVYAGK